MDLFLTHRLDKAITEPVDNARSFYFHTAPIKHIDLQKFLHRI